MHTHDHDDNKNILYYAVNGDQSLRKLTSINIEVSEEDEARLWAMLEGLTIVE